MNIKILGTGCANCKALEKAVNLAVEGLEIETSVVKEEDIVKIMAYGIMRTPGLVINEKLVLSGRIASISEIKEIILKEKQND